MTRYLIVGNGAAGVTAAEEIREVEPQAEVTIVNAEKHPMYSRPGLAYVVINEIPDRQVIARQPEWYSANNFQVVQGAAAHIDVARRQLELGDGRRLPYDRLLIATGARAVPLPYPGHDLDGVVYLDTLDGTRDLLRRAKRARRAVVVGGGITAFELVEGLLHHKVETHFLVRKDTLWGTVFNESESRAMAERMTAHGVRIHFRSEVSELIGDRQGRVSGVRLNTGEILPCDLVGAGIGVKPQIKLVHDTGISVDKGILVNEYLETVVPGIYAAGDCAQVWDRWTERYTLDSLWPSAVAAGRIAGRNMTTVDPARRLAYVKGIPFNACLLFGLHITAMGQLGGGREVAEPEIVQHISRGSSEVWESTPHAYASAWSAAGTNSLRLVLAGERLVGALVMGQQTLADPLRDLIEWGTDLSPLRADLDRGGPDLADRLLRFWRLAKMRQAPEFATTVHQGVWE